MPFFGPLSLALPSPMKETDPRVSAFSQMLAQQYPGQSFAPYVTPSSMGDVAGFQAYGGGGGGGATQTSMLQALGFEQFSPLTPSTQQGLTPESVTGAMAPASNAAGVSDSRDSPTGGFSIPVNPAGLGQGLPEIGLPSSGVGMGVSNIQFGQSAFGAQPFSIGAGGGGGGLIDPTITGTLSPGALDILTGTTAPSFGGVGAAFAAENAGIGGAGAAGVGTAGALGINAAPGAELGMGIGATLAPVEAAGTGLLGSIGWAALPLSILGMSGAFGEDVQGFFGFGNRGEQIKNQAHEARVLQRDLATVGPQAQAGWQAAFDLGGVSGLPMGEQAGRLQELEHALLTGYNTGPVFSRAGGPDRGTQDVDTLIGLIRARDALAKQGLGTLRGTTATGYGPELDPNVWLPRLAGYATAQGQPRLNLQQGTGFMGEGTQTPEGFVANPQYDPTATSLESVLPQGGFAPGGFESGILALLQRLSPSFGQSLLSQRLGILPRLT